MVIFPKSTNVSPEETEREEAGVGSGRKQTNNIYKKEKQCTKESAADTAPKMNERGTRKNK